MSDFDFPHHNDLDDAPPDVQIAELKDRIAELEAVIDRVKALPPKFSHSDLAPYGRYFANELQAVLEQDDE